MGSEISVSLTKLNSIFQNMIAGFEYDRKFDTVLREKTDSKLLERLVVMVKNIYGIPLLDGHIYNHVGIPIFAILKLLGLYPNLLAKYPCMALQGRNIGLVSMTK
jgi:hypothetical protein